MVDIDNFDSKPTFIAWHWSLVRMVTSAFELEISETCDFRILRLTLSMLKSIYFRHGSANPVQDAPVNTKILLPCDTVMTNKSLGYVSPKDFVRGSCFPDGIYRFQSPDDRCTNQSTERSEVKIFEAALNHSNQGKFTKLHWRRN